MVRPKSKQPKQARSGSDLSAQIVERWGDAGGDVPLDRLISELGDVQRYDIVAALKELERAGAGEFLVGRAGRKARFVWGSAKARAAIVDGASRARGSRKQAEPEPAGRKRAGNAVTAGKKVAREGKGKLPVAAKVASRPVATGPARREAGSALEHVFHLRPGFVVSVRLPSDISRVEMERLSQFLQAIPFEGDED
ncbi:MAG: hypothetical protein ABW321_11610 [Polyangiales bacterium]